MTQYGEIGRGKLGSAGTEYAKSAIKLDGKTSKCSDILQGDAQGRTLSPTLFKVFINDIIRVIEAAKQGVNVGEDTISGLMFAHDFVGTAETPDGLQKQIEKALEYTRKWIVTANKRKQKRDTCMRRR